MGSPILMLTLCESLSVAEYLPRQCFPIFRFQSVSERVGIGQAHHLGRADGDVKAPLIGLRAPHRIQVRDNPINCAALRAVRGSAVSGRDAVRAGSLSSGRCQI